MNDPQVVFIECSAGLTPRSLLTAAPRPIIMFAIEVSRTEPIAEWAMLRTPPCSFLSSCP